MTEPDTIPDAVRRLQEARRASRAQRIARGDRLAALLDAADREGERREREEKAIERERERARLLDLLGKAAPQRQRQRKPWLTGSTGLTDDPNALLTAHQAAQHLNVTTEQLLGHVHDGALRALNMSRGEKRGRYRFTPADLDQFKASRITQEQPCPSSPQRNRKASIGTISSCKVIGFTARRALLLAAKPRNSKR
jgi:hypothetical protein